MRLHEIEQDRIVSFLKAHDADTDSESIAVLSKIEEIVRDCKPFLAEMKNDVFAGQNLYRGIKSTEVTLTKQIRLEGRTPTHMDPAHHLLINNFFIDKFGAAFRNSMFASGDSRSAAYFGDGNVFMVFPIGDYRAIWSPEILDLYELDWFRFDDDERFKELDTYVEGNLISAIQSNNEIMVRASGYHAVKVAYSDRMDVSYAYFQELIK